MKPMRPEANPGHLLSRDLHARRVSARIQPGLDAQAGVGGRGPDEINNDFVTHQRTAATMRRCLSLRC